MTTPRRLADWTFDAINQLVVQNAHEPAYFDWKAQLPPDQSGKDRLTQECVAMANAGGACLIFGVADKERVTPADRIRGIPSGDVEFAKQFGDIVRRADPAVAYEVLNPPIAIPDQPGRVLQVVEILPLSAPHSYRGTFYRRTDATGAQAMTTREVIDMISRREEQRQRLRMLILELVAARDAAQVVTVSQSYRKALGLRPIDTRLIGQLHAELLPLLASAKPELPGRVTSARQLADVYNAMLQIAFYKMKSDPHLPSGRHSLGQGESNLDYLYYELDWNVSRLAFMLEELAKEIASTFGEPRPTFLTNKELAERGY